MIIAGRRSPASNIGPPFSGSIHRSPIFYAKRGPSSSCTVAVHGTLCPTPL